MKKLLIFISFLTLFFFCCSKDDETEPLKDFNTCVKKIPYITQDAEKSIPEFTGSENVTGEDGLICTESTYSYAPGYSDPILLDPTTDVIAPGMILDGSSITSGSYRPLGGDRAPLKISHSTNGESAIIQNPTLSEIRAGIATLNNEGVNPANMIYKETFVSSREQLLLDVGGNFKGFGAKVQARFNWDSKTVKSRFMIKFTQVYYSIDVDHPTTPSAWYTNPPNCQQWDVSPVYVSSVKYGRIGILLIESDKSELDVKAALKASYDGFGTSSKFDFKSEYEHVWESTSISALLVGGSPEEGVNIGTKEGFIGWINNGVTYSEESPGAPVAYSLRYLKDNSVSKVILSGSFTVRDCEEVEPFNINDNNYEDCCPSYNGEGDYDFRGHGPKQTAYAKLRILDGDVMLTVKYDVIQSDEQGNPYGDGTSGSFYSDELVFTPPPGYEVVEILTPDSTVFEAVDNSIAIYFKDDYQNGKSLVKSFEIMGDTKDNDVGPNFCTKYTGDDKKLRSYLAVKFYPVKVKIKKKD
jgi:thiol-activated cytolysin